MAAPWHNYLFLTKNPNRYVKLAHAGILPRRSHFFTEPQRPSRTSPLCRPDKGRHGYNTFVARANQRIWTQPYGESLTAAMVMARSETETEEQDNPKLEWIESVITEARRAGTPLLMRQQERARLEGRLIQEVPPIFSTWYPVPHCRNAST
jgi:hypothetical protein